MTVEFSGGGGGRMRQWFRESIRRLHTHAWTHTHTYEAEARMLLERLECLWPHKGEKQKGERGEVGRCEWP